MDNPCDKIDFLHNLTALEKFQSIFEFNNFFIMFKIHDKRFIKIFFKIDKLKIHHYF